MQAKRSMNLVRTERGRNGIYCKDNYHTISDSDQPDRILYDGSGQAQSQKGKMAREGGVSVPGGGDRRKPGKLAGNVCVPA